MTAMPPRPPGTPILPPAPQQPEKSNTTLIVILVSIGAVLALVVVIGLLLGILVPALGAAKKTAQFMKQGTSLRMIGQELTLYADAHNNQFPVHVGELIATGKVPADRFVSPLAGGTPPTYMPGKDPGPIYQFGDFWFVYKGMEAAIGDTDAVLAFSRVLPTPSHQRSVYFADGSVRPMPEAEFVQVIAKQNERRTKEWHVAPIDLAAVSQ